MIKKYNNNNKIVVPKLHAMYILAFGVYLLALHGKKWQAKPEKINKRFCIILQQINPFFI